MFIIADKKSGKRAYATVWNAEDKGKYSSIRMSTSEKDRDGSYKNSNWFAVFVGDAHTKASNLQTKDRIIITSGKVENISRKDADGKFLPSNPNVVVFDFETSESAENSPMSEPPEVEEDNTDSDLPF